MSCDRLPSQAAGPEHGLVLGSRAVRSLSHLCVGTVAPAGGKDISRVLSKFADKAFLDFVPKIVFLRDLCLAIHVVLPPPPLQ